MEWMRSNNLNNFCRFFFKTYFQNLTLTTWHIQNQNAAPLFLQRRSFTVALIWKWCQQEFVPTLRVVCYCQACSSSSCLVPVLCWAGLVFRFAWPRGEQPRLGEGRCLLRLELGLPCSASPEPGAPGARGGIALCLCASRLALGLGSFSPLFRLNK